ncbi:hypothetical protein C8R45DRAFT_1091470 [Mycena sanguinolenta]|nr:hypothetical protein C8R45DRAFT_1091470 [Mycena sanguinolenta]
MRPIAHASMRMSEESAGGETRRCDDQTSGDGVYNAGGRKCLDVPCKGREKDARLGDPPSFTPLFLNPERCRAHGRKRRALDRWSSFPARSLESTRAHACAPLLPMLFRPPAIYPPSSLVSSSQAPRLPLPAHSHDVPAIFSTSPGLSIPCPHSVSMVPRLARFDLDTGRSACARLNSATTPPRRTALPANFACVSPSPPFDASHPCSTLTWLGSESLPLCFCYLSRTGCSGAAVLVIAPPTML